MLRQELIDSGLPKRQSTLPSDIYASLYPDSRSTYRQLQSMGCLTEEVNEEIWGEKERRRQTYKVAYQNWLSNNPDLAKCKRDARKTCLGRARACELEDRKKTKVDGATEVKLKEVQQSLQQLGTTLALVISQIPDDVTELREELEEAKLALVTSVTNPKQTEVFVEEMIKMRDVVKQSKEEIEKLQVERTELLSTIAALRKQ